MIQDNLAEVRRNIVLQCEKVGRNPSEVTLIAVSKTKPLSMVQEAMEADQLVFGENKVQEMCEKHASLSNYENVEWHLIGHLQSNKVKKAVSVAKMIHSVDSLDLAREIDRQAAKIDKIQDILLEVNVAEEETKFGFRLEQAAEAVPEILSMKNVRLRGFMTVAPFTDDPESNRNYFKSLKQLMIDINARYIDNKNIDVLSMGMSGDYKVAIEEGATHIRVGTFIFGERDYSLQKGN